MEPKLFFAGFIMTYDRANQLSQTIDQIFLQTKVPSKLLIIDNSENEETKVLIEKINHPLIEYVSVGYNAGPAGAAKIGLQRLTNEGYQWIYWGDDDDPPEFEDSFEKLLALAERQQDTPVGMVGAVGHYFNRRTGEIVRVRDSELSEAQFLAIDSIAGNQCMIVNAKVVRAGVLPDERLFFGLEELDFCLRVKRAGFLLLASCELFLRSRQKYNKLDFIQPVYVVKSLPRLRREYYSVRNGLMILKTNKLYTGYTYQLTKSLAKLVYGFRFGSRYGLVNFKMVFLGIIHSFMNKTGKTTL